MARVLKRVKIRDEVDDREIHRLNSSRRIIDRDGLLWWIGAHNGGGEKWRYSNGGESNGGYQRGSTRFLTGDRSRAEALRERNNGLPKITWAPLLAVRNETCWKP
uniref:Uncharacterized protein n=1 Tax=Vespula pensylvanica TaxID=30213 RepID=A0A834JRY1_VESPE|nr:hypothetical protein H0235_017306 [Vespula pensylvanica]